ncbi:alpha-2-macroglobulin-like [Rhinatrema bivittatum]|uniref:alpha-2-macroglobulin-like n=1 Tax=Rhinatrema bivittatum TaxID=194408 RepID=UPI00112E8D1B|nr:alpha-2-macroglobulin-like [Rhinatrema bivittatum]
MWSGLLLLLNACLLHCVLAADSEPRIMLIMPSLIKNEKLEKACMQFLYHKETVNITVSMVLDEQNSIIFQEIAEANQPFSKCQEFKVPKSEKPSLAYVTISAKGATVNFLRNRNVVSKSFPGISFMQLDKPLYSGEQTVHYRLVAMDQTFRPVNKSYSRVYVQDPDGNRIQQWDNVASVRGIAEGDFTLDKEPMLGTYSITGLTDSGEEVSQFFSVDNYVLPKFKPTVNVPQTLTITDREFNASVCAINTYGEPVQGTVKMQVCRKNYRFYPEGTCSRYREGICKEFTGELGSDGCFKQLVDTQVFQLERAGLSMSFDIEATLTENGTGIQSKERGYVWISNQMSRLYFVYDSMNQFYRQGLNYTGELTLQGADGKPLANETVELEVDGKNVVNCTTDEDGSASFSVDTSNFNKSRVQLLARYKKTEECNDDFWVMPQYPQASYYISRFYSPSGSFLQISKTGRKELKCGSSASIRVNYILNEEELGQDAQHFSFYHVIMAQGEIMLNGETARPEGSSLNGFFDVNFSVGSMLAPVAHLMVYAIFPRGEVILDSLRFDVESCFNNKVSLNFSSAVARPGSNVTVLLDSARDSLCAIQAVDQSVLLLRQEEQLSPQMLYSRIPIWEFLGYYHEGFDVNEPELPCVTPHNVLFHGIEYEPVRSYGEGDVYEIASGTGLKIIVNSELRRPNVCEKQNKVTPRLMKANAEAAGFGGAERSSTALFSAADSAASVETVRSFFPESWLWLTQDVDANGRAQFSVRAPDTITEWKANAFCMNEQVGIGIAGPTTLKVFQPFFIEPVLPHSIVRGEEFILKCLVYNYGSSCMKVRTVLEPSKDFQAVPISTEEDNTGCFCRNERKTITWNFTATALWKINITVSTEITHEGASCSALSNQPMTPRKDTVIRELLVEPEGIEKEVVQSSFICTKNTTVSTPIQILLPDNLVEGSARGSCTVLGDILGSALQNIKKLLQMPFGCGEQNMATFMPNVNVMNYLNATKQLTEEIKAEGVRNIQAGIQRHMQYRNSDGSYSFFRQTGGTAVGNVWLTAQTYGTLAQCAKYVFVDENMQKQTESAISNRQQKDGGFLNQGELFNSYLKGGLNDDVALTAFIAIQMQEAELLPTHPVVQNALSYLEAAEQHTDDVYTQILMFCAFTMAGNKEKSAELESKVKAKAIMENELIHWERLDKPQGEVYPFFYRHAASADIEMTAYMLYALFYHGPPTDLQYATKMVRWLMRQANNFGGFSSTQDTVVAIKSLTKYATYTFTKDGNNEVRILYNNNVEHTLQAADSNRLVVQRRDLKHIPGDYAAEVSGNGCVLLQATVRYNIKLASNKPSFQLSVTSPDPCTDLSRKKFELHVNLSYTGFHNASNMAIVDVTLLSGYNADQSSLDELTRNRIVSKTETPTGHLLLYLMQVTSEIVGFSVTLQLDYPINNVQPRLVQVYSYYETDEYAQTMYNSPCSSAESSS